MGKPLASGQPAGTARRELGSVVIKGRKVVLSVNSAGRAEKGRAMLSAALGNLAGEPVVEIRTVVQVLTQEKSRMPMSDLPELPPELMEQAVHQLMDNHYRETLDEPIPQLANRTPREAAGAARSRAKVAQWLKQIENDTSRHAKPGDPMASYSFGWIWKELGLEDLRT